MLKRSDLHAYQRQAIEFTTGRPKCALWLDMGLGKTVSTLTALSDLIDDFAINKTLIIAPKRVAQSVWPAEVEKWEHLKHLRVSVALGTPKQRLKALDAEADLYVINRENVAWLKKHFGTKWPFDCIVIDEASSFKSHKSSRVKALRSVHVQRVVTRTIELTATPAANGYMDLWAQFVLLDGGKTLGDGITKYKEWFFYQPHVNSRFKLLDGAKERIDKAIERSDLVLSMKAIDHLKMPERVEVNMPVTLDGRTKKLYKELEKNFILKLGDDTITAFNAAALANKLLQFCNGVMYDEEGQEVEVHDGKIEALKELIEQNPNENLLVAYNYKSDLRRLREAFPEAVLIGEHDNTIEKWNHGEIKILLAHPASAGHGLNLQAGGSTVVWFGLNWSLEFYEQFNGRLWRQGQKHTTRIVHLVTEGGIDERVLSVLGDKAKTQNDLIEKMKREYKGVQ